MSTACDVFIERLTAAHRPLVAKYLAGGARVFAFDFEYRLRTDAGYRALIDSGKLTRILSPHATVAEGAAFEAAEWLWPRIAGSKIVAALRAYFGEGTDAVLRRALLESLFPFLFIAHHLAQHREGAGRGREVRFVPDTASAARRALDGWDGPAWARLPGISVAQGSRLVSVVASRGVDAARVAKGIALSAVILARSWRRRRQPVGAAASYDHAYAIDQPFQAKFQSRRRFDFLCDGVQIRRDNTVFLVHPGASGAWVETAKAEGFHVVVREARRSRRPLLETPPGHASVRGLGRVVRALLTHPFAPAWLTRAAALALEVALESASLTDRVRFATYVYTNQDMLDQQWRNLALRLRGAETWCFALSVGGGHLTEGARLPYATDPQHRIRLFAYQNCRHFVAPNAGIIAWHRRHRQRVAAYHDVGNIWATLIVEAGRATEQPERRAWFGDLAKGRRVVAWFDTSFVEEPNSPSTFREAIQWYRDIARLLEERYDLLMVIKPSKKESYFTEPALWFWHPLGHDVVRLWTQLREHPRVHFAGEAADPVNVIAASDVTVTFCYSSPTAEALGARRRALWYEPFDRWRDTPYDRDPRLVAHGYDELVKTMRWLLDEASEADYDTFLDTVVRGCVEDFLDGRGLSRFRALLAGSVE